jgi:membrane-bound lytic murein transglycosylase B
MKRATSKALSRRRARPRRILELGAALAALAGAVVPAARADVDTAKVARAKAAFVARMVEKHGFDAAALGKTLDGIQIDEKILETIAKPVERVVPWYEYRKIFLTEPRIEAGVEFWREHTADVDAASRRYGVAPEMLVAILGIETYFGQRMGQHRVLDALGTLAFAYPPRADFFAGELESLFLISRKEGPQMLDALGSYAGAMGAGQFIPSSFREYAVDADGDGRRDLWGDWSDILASVANYFGRNGWRSGEPVAARATLAPGSDGAAKARKAGAGIHLDSTVAEIGKLGYEFSSSLPGSAPAGVLAFEGEDGKVEYWVGYRNFRAITRYNTSAKYALAALELSRAIRSAYLGSAKR